MWRGYTALRSLPPPRSPRTQVGNRDINRWRCNAKMGRRLKSKPLIIVMDLRHASDAYRRPG
jgi:hypothetical protein